jgi:hypothetical protein
MIFRSQLKKLPMLKQEQFEQKISDTVLDYNPKYKIHMDDSLLILTYHGINK